MIGQCSFLTAIITRRKEEGTQKQTQVCVCVSEGAEPAAVNAHSALKTRLIDLPIRVVVD